MLTSALAMQLNMFNTKILIISNNYLNLPFTVLLQLQNLFQIHSAVCHAVQHGNMAASYRWTRSLKLIKTRRKD